MESDSLEQVYNEIANEGNVQYEKRNFNVKGKQVPFSPVLYNNVLALRKLVENKFDSVFVVDGMEGSGKSELAKQMCIIYNNDFCEKDVVYTADQFNQWLKTAKKGDICLWDEFVFAGLSTDALSEIQKVLIKQFTVMRSRRLAIVLVIPYFFMLRKYFAVSRTRFLLHTYTKGLKRGYVKFFGYTQKHLIYNYGQKTWLYSPKVKPTFSVEFDSWSDNYLDEALIEKKKQEALDSIEEDKNKKMWLTPRQTEVLSMLDTAPTNRKWVDKDHKIWREWIKVAKQEMEKRTTTS